MAFRTLEISNPAEIHVRRGQLEITNEEGIILILLEDLATIVCSGADVSANWQIILNTVYQHREKIPLLLKAGMGMEILRQINRSIDGVNEEYRLRLMAWNGVIFNCILWWAERNFADDPEALSRQLTEITEPLLTVQHTAFPSGK